MYKLIVIKFFLVVLFSSTIQISYAQCLEGDCINGYGKFTCDCGYLFEGMFKNGSRVTGTLTKEDLVYTGEFKYDLAHGFGIINVTSALRNLLFR